MAFDKQYKERRALLLDEMRTEFARQWKLIEKSTLPDEAKTNLFQQLLDVYADVPELPPMKPIRQPLAA